MFTVPPLSSNGKVSSPEHHRLVAEDIDYPRGSGEGSLANVKWWLRRFVSFASEAQLVAVSLWVAHTWLLDCFESSPRVAFLSPEPGSGKTRALEVIELVVPKPMHVLNASAPPIFRSIEADRPTLLFDEVDAIFTKRGKDDSAEDLRAMLNAGHRTGATIPRCVGARHDVVQFPVYAAVALAGLGDLPDTLMTRSLIIRMRRRAPGETVEPFRRRVVKDDGEDIAAQVQQWTETVKNRIGNPWPKMPNGITDRNADVWEPLLAIADAAGGGWPERARAACVELCKVTQSREASLGVKLLTDLRTTWGEADARSTADILEALRELEESPWGDLRGKELDPRGLARRLKAYGIEPTKVKVGADSLRGYRREDLFDAWERYLPTEETEPPEPAEPGVQDCAPDAAEVPQVPHMQEPETGRDLIRARGAEAAE